MPPRPVPAAGSGTELTIPPFGLQAILRVPPKAHGLVVFAHGSGSSRLSPRNVYVATALNEAGFATLLFDLLTRDEEDDRRNVFDVPLLAGRLVAAIDWCHRNGLRRLPVGLFGASTGAAAALVAAARLGRGVAAVVCRGGRADLAGEALGAVRAPTLLLVGGLDLEVIEFNRSALARLTCPKKLAIVPGATHLFPEPGALDAVIAEARRWFATHLARRRGNGGNGAPPRRA